MSSTTMDAHTTIERNSGLDLIQLFGRLCLAMVFFASGLFKIPDWAATMAMMTAKDLPMPELLLGGAAALQIVAGAFLLLGWHTRLAALVLAGFTVVATVIFHGFWNSPPDRFEFDFVVFMSNVALFGALLFIAGAGGGRHSLDNVPQD
ncbi:MULTISPECIES: DoxX family protein [Inquilinus]|uniref:Oxidoreductase n=1 Tax=Inquilinus ginsengisoli TaxID=363840 RepID=A0ABU1JSD4_9PROT|nr:DoxX family protein [Inquilinus ginsengisoli]MDR6291531.1 putative oxidoreductase [Inquilinus ginsengisoli]